MVAPENGADSDAGEAFEQSGNPAVFRQRQRKQGVVRRMLEARTPEMHIMAALLETAQIMVREPLSALRADACEVVRIVMVNQMPREMSAVSLERGLVPGGNQLLQSRGGRGFVAHKLLGFGWPIGRQAATCGLIQSAL